MPVPATQTGPASVRRLILLATVVGAVLLFVQPTAAPFPVIGTLAITRVRTWRQDRQRTAAVIDQLPDVVDLVALTTSAGLPVSSAIRAIGGRLGGPVGAAMRTAAAQIDRGASTSQALAVLPEACGGPSRGLVDALADHDRYGTPLGPVLERVGLEARLLRRRHAEEAARRLPVTLLFPLVLTTLPAFVLLTVVPMLVGSYASLQL